MSAQPKPASRGTKHENEPEQLFIREFSDFTGIARMMRSHVEELNQFRWKPGDSAGWISVKTVESSRVVTAMARLQSSQAASLRSLAQLRDHRDGTAKRVVFEYRKDPPPSQNEN